MFFKFPVKFKAFKNKQPFFLFIILILSVNIPTFYTLGESGNSNKEKVYELYREYQKSFSDIDEINPVNISKLNKDILFVDVRKEKEMNVSIIPGAVTKENYLNNKKLYHHNTIVAYCTIGYRSGLFAREMKEEGIKVYNLAGGILAWIHEGGGVINSKKVVKQVHVYGDKWDHVPEGYKTVTFGFLENLFN